MSEQIRIIDDINPEDVAMLQALYSRDPGPIDEKLEQLNSSDSGRFMEKFYVGYGHKSIGDCGVTTVFIEGISIYEVKLIEDSPLFSGQEASTRYIDFSDQGFVDLDEHTQATANYWLERYKELYEHTKEHLHEQYGDIAGINPCAFDISRCLLPLGMRTSVAWTTSLSHAREHLMHLAVHPLERARELAQRIHGHLMTHYPHSFSETDLERAQERYRADKVCPEPRGPHNDIVFDDTCMSVSVKHDYEDLTTFTQMLGTRAADFYTKVYAYGWLDFGSLRDLHRHRPAYTPLPFGNLLNGSLFLNGDLYAQKIDEIMGLEWRTELVEAFLQLPIEHGDSIMAYPLGTRVPVEFTTGPTHLAYVLKLRTGTEVHPTLRQFMHTLIYGLKMSRAGQIILDTVPDIDWATPAFVPSLLRGKQTIVRKE